MHWALLECYALKGLPPPVAVSVAVGWMRRRHGASEGAFVNGVLRGMLRDFPDEAALRGHLARHAPAAVQCELPGALYERWRAAFGEARTRALAALLQTPAPATARRRGGFAPGAAMPPGGVMRTSGEDFDPAQWYLQDPSTLLAPLLLAARPGEVLADLCAAPGGKSLVLAERLGGTGRLDCRDRSAERLEAVRENLAGYANVTIAEGDAAAPELAPGGYDGVLLDVPCSNTGVIRRRPDVRANFTTAGLQELVALQRRILDGAAPLVKAGGRLVYSTCSIEGEENAQQVAAFLARHPEYSLIRQQQLYPTAYHDGAFAALLARR